MTDGLPRPLSDAEIDRLEAHLASPGLAGQAMRADVLQGFFAAIASGPVLVPASIWMPVALGEAPSWESEAQRREATGLVMRFYGEIALALAEGRGVEPILYAEGPEDDAPLDYAAWCEGYLAGVELSDPPWEDFADDAEALAAILTPFLALAFEGVEPDPENPGPFDDLSRARRAGLADRARQALPEAVQEAHDYFLERRQKPEPVRREGPKAGRNDPCPCGSGKKYKHCCGAGS